MADRLSALVVRNYAAGPRKVKVSEMKTKWVKYVPILCVVVLPGFLLGEDVQFSDPGLEAAVREKLGIDPPTPVTDLDMLNLVELSANLKNIVDLTGLEYAVNAEDLRLQKNAINDISTLSGLTKLERLHLYQNQISNLSPISGLTGLWDLNLSNNHITDVSPLSGLPNLWFAKVSYNRLTSLSGLSLNANELDFRGNQINDVSGAFLSAPWDGDVLLSNNQISSLSGGVLSAGHLDLSHNQISTISGALLNSENLNLSDNRICNFASLAGLIGIEYINLSNNQIQDISFSTWLIGTKSLDLSNNQIVDASPLSSFTHFEHLNLSGNQISNLTGSSIYASFMLNLSNNEITDLDGTSLSSENVDLSRNQISTLAGVAFPGTEGMPMWELDLSDNLLADITPLSTLSEVSRLRLDNNRITTLSPLSGCTKLSGLYASGNRLADVSGVAGRHFILLDLSNNVISNIDALADMAPRVHGPSWSRITLSNNRISDLSPLAELTNYAQELKFYLRNNLITDVSPLAELHILDVLDLRDNPLGHDAYDIYLPLIEANNPGISLYYDPYGTPFANAGGPYTVEAEDMLTIDASGSMDLEDDIVSYLWDLDYDGVFETDGGNQSIIDIEFADLAAVFGWADLWGDHIIRLQVTDLLGYSDTADALLTVVPEPATLSLMALGGFALLRRGKRRMCK